MDYLSLYTISKNEIKSLKNLYNNNIIKFLKINKEFVSEKLDYLTKEQYNIYPILESNIKIFLEDTEELKRKVNRMINNNLSKEQIQIVLMDVQLYSKI